MHPTSLSAGEGLNLQPNFQKGGGLEWTPAFRGSYWERGGEFFQGEGMKFHIDKKLEPPIVSLE